MENINVYSEFTADNTTSDGSGHSYGANGDNIEMHKTKSNQISSGTVTEENMDVRNAGKVDQTSPSPTAGPQNRGESSCFFYLPVYY